MLGMKYSLIPEERIEFLEGQLAEDPENAEILNELATLYEGQGNREKLLKWQNKLYELEPNFR